MSSKSHFIILLIPAAAIALKFVSSERDWLSLAILILTALLGIFSARDIIGDQNSEVLLAIGSVAICTLLLGFGCLRICWHAGAQGSMEGRTSVTQAPGTNVAT
ncbi:MAG: hypothetical protein VX726_08455 [Planctomycetota bacterium]|nr:hypothetical protein [Planctomycetota bacterium]